MASRGRSDGRRADELRRVTVEMDCMKFARGSALIRAGNTAVLCTASVEENVPPFLAGKGVGWLTAEYAMLPASTPTRKPRESSSGRTDGRTQEIRRIIGRALRAAVDLNGIGERTLLLDCDVLQADGGTRTLAVTGAWLALAMAVRRLQRQGLLSGNPVRRQIAATSVGIVTGRCLLDLAYDEDSRAEVDMNVVMTDDERFIEIQGTAENEPFDERRLGQLLALARNGCRRLMKIQNAALRAWEKGKR
ncbi:MAG: ribonuclease PH [Candidatus Brocadiia bacterium]